MLYQAYQKKLEKATRVLNFFWRFRYLVLGILLLIIALIVTLFSIAGNIYGEICPSSVEYGTALSFEAKAIFGKTVAEYRPKGETEWTREEPRLVGEYEVRAVCERTFKNKYGKVFTYTIEPRVAQIEFIDRTFVYGSNPEVSVSLAYADAAEGVEFTFARMDENKFAVTAQATSIVNQAGESVTACYKLLPYTETLSCEQQALSIAAESASKIYDGTPLCATSYTITSGTLIGEDRMELVWGSQTDVGSTENRPELAIYNASGEDVTDLYAIEWEPATLEVLPRELLIQAESAQKVYDGTPLTMPSGALDPATPLVPGHRMQILSFPSLTDVGTCENLPQIKIVDETERDVTSNYRLASKTGQLTIVPRPVTVWTASCTWIYDGGAHNAVDAASYGVSEHSAYELVAGQILQPTAASVVENTLTEITDSETEVIYRENALLFDVWDESGTKVTKNYAFTYEYGKLRIKTEIIVSLYSLSKYYDGLPIAFSSEDYTIVKPPDVEVACVLPTLTEVGSLWADALGADNISVRDAVTGQDVMAENRFRFEPYADLPVLEIRPREIEVSSISVVSENRTEAIYGSLIPNNAWISFGSLAEGERIEIVVVGVLLPQDNVAVENTIQSVTIYDQNDRDVSANYQISLCPGYLEWLH